MPRIAQLGAVQFLWHTPVRCTSIVVSKARRWWVWRVQRLQQMQPIQASCCTACVCHALRALAKTAARPAKRKRSQPTVAKHSPASTTKGTNPTQSAHPLCSRTLPKHARKKAATKCAACWLAAESAVTAPKKRDKAKSCVVWGACMRWEHTCRRGVWMQNRAQQGFC